MSKNRTEQPNIASDRIDTLEKDEIFVFGSNLAGRHMGGAARAAHMKFGAEWGIGMGLTGRSYAIPTMQGGVDTIRPYVNQFVEYARNNPDMRFLVTRIGCGIAGFKDEEIAPLFKDAVSVSNIYLPRAFYNILADSHPYSNIRKAIFGIKRHRMGIDGKGITTLVAFMGCPLHCKYCLNDRCHAPLFENDGKTLRKGIQMLSPKELFDIVKKDNVYFQVTGGGICFGGGEPTMNADFIIEFAKICSKNWKLTIETSLRCSDEAIEALSEYIDEWIVDVKDMNSSIYESYTRGPSEITQRLQCLKMLVPMNRITIKVPLIPHFNTMEDVEKSIGQLKKMGFENIAKINYIER